VKATIRAELSLGISLADFSQPESHSGSRAVHGKQNRDDNPFDGQPRASPNAGWASLLHSNTLGPSLTLNVKTLPPCPGSFSMGAWKRMTRLRS
jgi:hypothetical protein